MSDISLGVSRTTDGGFSVTYYFDNDEEFGGSDFEQHYTLNKKQPF